MNDPVAMPRVGSLLSPAEETAIRSAFHDSLPSRRDLQPHLRGVIDHVLGRPGSLVRAHLSYAVLTRMAPDMDPAAATDLAIGTEYFHTASLIFDDLPAMDDAMERRGHTCPHRKYGEAAAMLGALALINRGYALLWRRISDLPDARRRRAMELVESCLGVDGVLDGQARDLHFAQGPRGPAEVLEIAEGKTVSLIRLTLLLPAIAARVDHHEEALLEQLCQVWGLTYQILDDFKDHLMSRHESGKSNGRDSLLGRPNFPTEAGAERAWSHARVLLNAGRRLLDELVAVRPQWQLLEHVQGILQRDRHDLRRLQREAA